MKKIFAILLAVTMLASMATVVSAAESTTTLSTTVPAATYVMNIPANQEIEFGATSTMIGTVTLTNGEGFAVGKNVAVTITYDAFKCSEVSTTIPFALRAETTTTTSLNYSSISIPSEDTLIFKGLSSGSVAEKAEKEFSYETAVSGGKGMMPVDKLFLTVKSADWGKALGGEYTATITFTAEVVAG